MKEITNTALKETLRETAANEGEGFINRLIIRQDPQMVFNRFYGKTTKENDIDYVSVVRFEGELFAIEEGYNIDDGQVWQLLNEEDVILIQDLTGSIEFDSLIYIDGFESPQLNYYGGSLYVVYQVDAYNSSAEAELNLFDYYRLKDDIEALEKELIDQVFDEFKEDINDEIERLDSCANNWAKLIEMDQAL